MSHDPSAFFKVETLSGVTVITVLDSQISTDAKDPLYALTDRVKESPPPRRVVLNLENVKALTSANIGVLINFQKRIRDAAGALRLCNLDPYVMNIFQLTRMDQILEARPNLRDAIDSFAGGSRSKSGSSSTPTSWVSRIFGGKSEGR